MKTSRHTEKKANTDKNSSLFISVEYLEYLFLISFVFARNLLCHAPQQTILILIITG